MPETPPVVASSAGDGAPGTVTSPVVVHHPAVQGTVALSQSMMLLEESLESNAVVGQFEQVAITGKKYRLMILYSEALKNSFNFLFKKYRLMIPVLIVRH